MIDLAAESSTGFRKRIYGQDCAEIAIEAVSSSTVAKVLMMYKSWFTIKLPIIYLPTKTLAVNIPVLKPKVRVH